MFCIFRNKSVKNQQEDFDMFIQLKHSNLCFSNSHCIRFCPNILLTDDQTGEITNTFKGHRDMNVHVHLNPKIKSTKYFNIQLKHA